MLHHARRLIALSFPLALLVSSASLARAQSLKLTGSYATFGVTDMRVSAGGRWVVYREDAELFSRRLDRGSGPTRINGTVFPETGFSISPDGSRVVFDGIDAFPSYDVYSVPIDGSEAPTKLSATTGKGIVFPRSARISPDGTRVVYKADEQGVFVFNFHSVPIDGSAPSVKLIPPGFFEAVSFAITADGQQVVYSAVDQTVVAPEPDLFVVPIDASAPAVKLNQQMPGVSGINFATDFRIAPDGQRVVYWGERNTPGGPKLRLFTVPIDASALPLQLGGAPGNVRLSPSSTVTPFAISPDGSRVAYVADQRAGNLFELFSAPIDASSAAIRLSADLVAGGDVSSAPFGALPFQIHPDGSGVAYSADQELDDRFELYRVPIDGSAAAIKLSGPLATGGDVASFRYGPTGAEVAYVGDQDTDDVLELYAVPSDGSGAPVKLNAPLVLGGDVTTAIQFDPSGSGVLYLADQRNDEVFELFVSPVDASSASREINPDPIPGGDVSQTLAFVPFRGIGGPYVLYAGDLFLDQVSDIYLGFLFKPVRPVPMPLGLTPGR